MKLGAKFSRCVKSVRKTIRPRKGSTKEGAAIAICTKTVLYPRGKTIKRYTKKRLTTQRRMKGGAGATAEGNVLVEMYVLLDSTPTRESLVRVADEIDELTEPDYKVKEYKNFVRGLRGILGSPDFNLDHVVRTAKQLMAERLLSDEDKETIRERGHEVSAKNMWEADS